MQWLARGRRSDMMFAWAILPTPDRSSNAGPSGPNLQISLNHEQVLFPPKTSTRAEEIKQNAFFSSFSRMTFVSVNNNMHKDKLLSPFSSTVVLQRLHNTQNWVLQTCHVARLKEIPTMLLQITTLPCMMLAYVAPDSNNTMTPC